MSLEQEIGSVGKLMDNASRLYVGFALANVAIDHGDFLETSRKIAAAFGALAEFDCRLQTFSEAAGKTLLKGQTP